MVSVLDGFGPWVVQLFSVLLAAGYRFWAFPCRRRRYDRIVIGLLFTQQRVACPGCVLAVEFGFPAHPQHATVSEANSKPLMIDSALWSVFSESH